MAGRRKFDEDEVLDRALMVFWQRGYGATSIDDLTAATGLKRGSLYAAFADKEKLFIACLRRYTQRVQTPMIEALHHPDPRQAIALMFEKRHGHSSNPEVPPGCLLTNTVLERASISEAITQGADIIPTIKDVQSFDPPRRVRDTGEGDTLRHEIAALELLLRAYRENVLPERTG